MRHARYCATILPPSSLQTSRSRDIVCLTRPIPRGPLTSSLSSRARARSLNSPPHPPGPKRLRARFSRVRDITQLCTRAKHTLAPHCLARSFLLSRELASTDIRAYLSLSLFLLYNYIYPIRCSSSWTASATQH